MTIILDCMIVAGGIGQAASLLIVALPLLISGSLWDVFVGKCGQVSTIEAKFCVLFGAIIAGLIALPGYLTAFGRPQLAAERRDFAIFMKTSVATVIAASVVATLAILPMVPQAAVFPLSSALGSAALWCRLRNGWSSGRISCKTDVSGTNEHQADGS